MRAAIIVVLWVSGALAASAYAEAPYYGHPVTNLTPAKMPVVAQGAAVSPDGTVLYVTDSLDRVLEYGTFFGNYLGGWGSPGSGAGQFGSAQFNNPHGITADPYGNVWVADTDNNRVLKFTSGGTFLKSFSTAKPIGVAATSTRLYVLSGLFRAVDVRSLAGKDLGAFIATFPDGYDTTHYGTPSNSADGITTDASGNAVVAGTVSQPLVDSDRSFCQSPMQDYNPLRPLPDTLNAPAVATFSPTGTNLGQAFTFSPGALCWTDDQDAWSYGRGDRHAAGSAALDPATGLVWNNISEYSQPVWAASSERDYLPMWGPACGPTPYSTLCLSGGFGDLRALAIGCDSTMYFVTDKIIQRFSSSTPDYSHCRILKAPSTIQLLPALGNTPPPGSSPGKLTFNAICHGSKTCSALVNIVLAPCPKCRPELSIKKLVKVPPGGVKLVTAHLPPRIVTSLKNGHPLIASAGIGRVKTLMPVRLPTSLTTVCGGATGALASARSFTVSGVLSPARRGLHIQVVATGPDGLPVLLGTAVDSGGRWSLQVPATSDGLFTVAARLPGTRTLAPAQTDCNAVVGNPVLVQMIAADNGPPISSLYLTLSCPSDATPGQSVAVPGTVAPADPDRPIALSFNGPGGVSSTASATPGGDGNFATQFTPSATGTWTVTAQASRAGTTLTQTCSIPVARTKTKLTLTCPSSALPYPGSHDFGGTLSPAVPGATVTVTFTPQPGAGSAVSAIGTVDSQGNYTVTFNEPAPGQWTAQASWPGDAAHEGATSSGCVFMVG